MSAARDISGPWLSHESMEALPEVKREFDLNRDPFIARQIRDLDASEGQRREEQSGGREIARKASRRTEPKPGLTIAPPANTQRMSAHWLSAKRDAAFAQTLPSQTLPNRSRSQTQKIRTRQLEPGR